jgi:hypothetical protein
MLYRCTVDVLTADVLQVYCRCVTGVMQTCYRYTTDVVQMYCRCATDILQMCYKCTADVIHV